MRWMLGLFAVVGLLVIGLAVAIASGLVNVSAFDPFSKLNAAATRPSSGPSDEDSTDAEKPIDSEASLAALKHPGYQERVVFLSAADAKVMGPRVQLEARTSSSYYSGRSGRGGVTVDPKNRLPTSIIRGWTSPDDQAEWTLNVPQAGKYVITFDCIAGYGGARDTAGGKFVISAGAETLRASVEVDVSGRRGGTAFHLIDVGTIKLPAGQVKLTIRPDEKSTGLLALRSVRIYPAD